MIYKIEKYEVIDLIKAAISEDMGGFGDITSRYLIPEKDISSGYIVCKEESGGILSGMDVASYLFEEIDPKIKVSLLKEDGSTLDNMEKVCDSGGPGGFNIKSGKDCLKLYPAYVRYSNILPASLQQIAEPYGVKIVDTRKTKPSLEENREICSKMRGRL